MHKDRSGAKSLNDKELGSNPTQLYGFLQKQTWKPNKKKSKTKAVGEFQEQTGVKVDVTATSFKGGMIKSASIVVKYIKKGTCTRLCSSKLTL